MNAESTASLSSLPRVTPRLAPALGGIWRLTWRRVFAPRRALGSGLLLVILGLLTYLFAARPEDHDYFEWVYGFMLLLVTPIVAFLAGAGAVREDLKSGAVDYVMTRSVSRPAYVIFKYVAQVICNLIAGWALVAFLLAVGGFAGQGGLMSELSRLLVVVTGAITAFTALGFFCGTLTSRYMVLGLFYAGVIEAGLGNIPIQINALSIARHLRVFLEGMGYRALTFTGETWSAAGLLAVISLGLVGVATLVFSRQEFIGSKEKDA
ncbi:hypothetical protein [Synoicihabitans lomoniglobus]|uniref:ABC transporter permease n=1 Tax=Synoicihabitans lomoniglobus TaxID=2909285 RepID=A0AAF0CIA9_9BACT|nr:ABC transporter permease [Opitutaceae bacterium LMO-M01]WED65177.1 hypothetical protein PXH66_22800 [Opitutaceae bacterium LMO-M01]